MNVLRYTSRIAVLLAFLVVMLGAFTRLTDAGLGCPDWPGCYGRLVLPTHQDALMSAQQIYPQVPIEAHKAWTEMIHRYAAGMLVMLIVVMFMAVINQRRQGKLGSVDNLPTKTRRPATCSRDPAILLNAKTKGTEIDRNRSREQVAGRRNLNGQHTLILWLIPSLLLMLIGFQAALGMWTVTLKLLPIVVMGHLLGGMLIFACLCYFCWQVSWRGSSSESLGFFIANINVTAHPVPSSRSCGLTAGSTDFETSLDPAVKPQEREDGYIEKPEQLHINKENRRDDEAFGMDFYQQRLKRLQILVAIGLLIVFCQIALGGWVSANYAGIACIGFPRCNGQWLVHLDFTHGFRLFSPVGSNYQGGLLSPESRITIQMVHRIGAFITIGYCLFLSGLVWIKQPLTMFRRFALLVALLVCIQFSLGVANVVYLLPLWVAVLHNGVAALLLGALVSLQYVVNGASHACRI